MNTITTRINAILLATVIACAGTQASENQISIAASEQQDTTTAQDSVVWYKKRSTHIVAALAATAVGIYALAVRKNKVAGPMALFAALFCVNKKAQEVKNADETKDADNKQQDNGNTESNKTAEPVNPDNQKIVTQEPTPAGNKEDDQSPIMGDVQKDILPTDETPLYAKAQQSLQNGLSGLKNWFTNGLENDSFPNN